MRYPLNLLRRLVAALAQALQLASTEGGPTTVVRHDESAMVPAVTMLRSKQNLHNGSVLS